MRQFTATIKGVTPFLFNRYFEEDESIPLIGKKPRDSTTVDEWRKKEAMLRVYENGHGPFLPARNIRSAMVEGARALQLKHKPVTGRPMALWPFLRRGLQVGPAELLFDQEFPKDIDFTFVWTPECEFMHRDTVRIPPQKGALVVKYWPKLEDWRLSFTLSVFDDSIQEEDGLQESIKAAGLFCGLGTGRPDFGKYSLVGWEEIS